MFDRQREIKQQRRKKFLSWFIVAVLVLSLGGFLIGEGDFGGGGRTERYSGYKFTLTEQGIRGKIQGADYFFNFFPSQVEYISVDSSANAPLKSPYLFITYDSESNYSQTMALAQYNLATVLGRTGQFVQQGAMQENNFNLPIVDCVNATEAQPVLAFVQAGTQGIEVVNSCIIAGARNEVGILQLHDRLLYQRLGVIE